MTRWQKERTGLEQSLFFLRDINILYYATEGKFNIYHGGDIMFEREPIYYVLALIVIGITWFTTDGIELIMNYIRRPIKK